MKEQSKIICSLCKKELIWNNDFDYEDYGREGGGIVGVYSCVNNKCSVEDIIIYTKWKNKTYITA